MAQVADIITDAYRESNLIAVNATPTADETTEGLNRLQALIKSTLGTDVSYIMEDWTLANATTITRPSGVPLTSAQASAYYIQPQSRIMASLTVATSVSLDPYPNDGQRFSVIDVAGNFGTYNLTIAGNGRLVNGGASLVLSTNSEVREFMFRSDIGDWVEIDTFTTADNLPFPTDFDDYFITSLAMRLNRRYGREMSPESVARLNEQRGAIIQRYKQSRLSGIKEQMNFAPPQG